MKFGDVPDEELLGMLSGKIPMPAKSEWDVAVVEEQERAKQEQEQARKDGTRRRM